MRRVLALYGEKVKGTTDKDLVAILSPPMRALAARYPAALDSALAQAQTGSREQRLCRFIPVPIA